MLTFDMRWYRNTGGNVPPTAV